jgi:hypothetical protein
MEFSTIYDAASDATRNFDNIDSDHNGHLNLLELQKYAVDRNIGKEKTDFWTNHHMDILLLENNDTNNRLGVSKHDLSTLEKCTGNPDAISKEVRQAGLINAVGGAFSAGMLCLVGLAGFATPPMWPLLDLWTDENPLHPS